MPTYQYACTNPDCGHRFELVQSFTDAAASECPVCGVAVRKVYGSVGVVFKGSGFYRTDSRASASASTGSAKSDSAKSDSAKSESKTSASSNGSSGAKSEPAASGSGAGSGKAAASA